MTGEGNIEEFKKLDFRVSRTPILETDRGSRACPNPLLRFYEEKARSISAKPRHAKTCLSSGKGASSRKVGEIQL